MTPQLPLDLSLEPALSREDLIESPANATAIAMIDAWPDWPGHVAVLAGPVGSGKTHIASVWADMADANRVSIGEFCAAAPDYIDHAASGGSLVLEDLDAPIRDETALFHLLNAVREAGGYCLLTSRSWPREWQIGLPDLKSRMLAAQLVELREPDDLLLRSVMAKLFADRQVEIEARVIEYCVLRMERSLESAARLVAAMDAIALSKKSLVTRAIAAEALKATGSGD